MSEVQTLGGLAERMRVQAECQPPAGVFLEAAALPAWGGPWKYLWGKEEPKVMS